MNAMDRTLARLLHAAARAPVPPAELTFATEARILGHWQASAGMNDGAGGLVWFRRGFALACALTIATAIISLTQTQPRSQDVWTLANAVVSSASQP